MTRLFTISLILLTAFSSTNVYGQTKALWTEADRRYLVTNLERTKHEIIKETQNLTPKQWPFKEESPKWLMGQVLEHLGVYEEFLYGDLLSNQYTGERPDLVDSVRRIDSIMLAYASDPNKAIVPYFVEPIGRFKDKQNLVSFFNPFRKAVIELIQATPTNFRLHFVFRPPNWVSGIFGTYISTHWLDCPY